MRGRALVLVAAAVVSGAASGAARRQARAKVGFEVVTCSACTTSKPVRVAVHAIFDGDHPGRTLGSLLTLSVGRATILGAVLQNKGDPNASRVYRAARFCRR
jgi:hypothetical protein